MANGEPDHLRPDAGFVDAERRQASVPGTFSWTTSATVPSAGTVQRKRTFTPTDLTDYNAVTGSVSVTVSAAAPTVTAVTPTNGLTGVAITSAVTATFNQPMDSSTITRSTFTADWAGKHICARQRRLTTPASMTALHSRLRRISPITRRTLRRSRPPLRVPVKSRWPRLTHGASPRRQRRFPPSRPPCRRAAPRA